MDRWRAATPRPILISIQTERTYSNQVFTYRARYCLQTYAGVRNYELSNMENHLHAAMEVLPTPGVWLLRSRRYKVADVARHLEPGDFIFELVP
jgi:hypothetical protein